MARNQRKWWKQFFATPEHKKIDSLHDIKAIIEFVETLAQDTVLLLPELKKLQELEEERRIAKPGLLQVNLTTQGETLNRILQLYEPLQDDVSINGIRLKEIIAQFLRSAKKAGLTDFVREKKQDPLWQLRW